LAVETVETLLIRTRLDIAGLKRKTKEAERTTNNATAKMRAAWNKTASGVSRLRGAIGLMSALIAGALVGSFAVAIKKSLDMADAIDKNSSKIGLSTEAYQKFAYAADISGVSAQTFAKSVQKLTQGFSEAQNNTGKAKNAIAELGLGLSDANGTALTTEEMFTRVMRALAGVEEPAKRLRLAVKLFGEEGASMVNMANDFDALTEEAEKLGIVMTAQTIADAVKAKDEFTRLSTITRATLTPALVQLAKDMIPLVKQLESVMKYTHEVFQVFSDTDALDYDHTIGRIVGKTDELIAAEEKLASLRNSKLGRMRMAVTGEYMVLVDEIAALKKEISDLESHRADLESALASSEAGGSSTDTQQDVEANASALEAIHKDYLRATEQTIQLIEEERDAKLKALDAMTLGEEEYNKARFEIMQAANADISAAVEASVEETAEKITQSTDKLTSEFEEMGKSASRAFADMLITGEYTFKQLGISLLRDFLSKRIQAGASTGMSALVARWGGAVGMFAGWFGGARADGGQVRARKTYLVGEHGPEMFVPGRSGVIVPNAQIGGQSATVNVTVITPPNHTADVTQTRGSDGGKNIQVMIVNAVNRHIASGGADRVMGLRYGAVPRGT